MSELIRVPDIGSGEGEVIEIQVKVGDRIEAEQSLVTLESDKASMEVPAPKAGVVKAIKVKIGDRLKEGDDLIELEAEGAGEAAAPAAEAAPAASEAPKAEEKPAAAPAPAAGNAAPQNVNVPDIGSSGKAQVIEIQVKVGDTVEADQSLITLESDKASMEIPSPAAGVVESISVKLNDEVGTGDLILVLKGAAGAAAPAAEQAPKAEAAQAPAAAPAAPQAAQAPAAASVQEIKVPDIGSSGKAKIIEVLVKAGDTVEADQSLITLESDKASMEIPSPAAGVVESVIAKLDDEVGTGDLILKLKVQGAAPAAQPAQAAAPAAEPAKAPAPAAKAEVPAEHVHAGASAKPGAKVHAGPAVRQLAREFGVDLSQVSATGPHGRVLKEDVQAYVKAIMSKAKEAPAASAAAPTGGAGIPPIPTVDFSRFGEIEEVPMTRLMQVGAANLHRSWLNVPHVTQFDQADITELEAFRVAQKAVAEKAGVKLTVLPLLLKACAYLLKELPDFNASLAPSGKAVIRKKYVHIGFAVDTPDGLLVPVIKNVDQKSLLQLAAEAAALAEKARNKKLSGDDMQGACFTISSLGHIGGTGFTPIVNAPEVAILGVSKAAMAPVWDGKAFQPRLMLPLSLSYDHRVINGAAAARFTKRLGDVLADIRTILL
ncbi:MULTISPECIES: dihydrolipoyllysine-residue acetyltransferase [unclassified Pseudomonas]|uniref:dihydrolipoyllysine-residue acetyltransferase n=1 Tax=unclassified Pseudomonas TaxID=196821 RepID=UPI000BD74978|nr:MULTISPECIES: dihydrolipoyllysine-residue acetyltransferase [unclassified Pseudomonas]PVZ15597.1 pyruvate dehydrogenase E2 component (dihydrolipoamide acetyltransferase) [Pseudomonas sp. URIL14HWK12:I12]PVZ24971.1 pyruvate dehydrogenase E2 component (dihydrolipoamide acetyltransferase) [Pseudomonas sp. URIL14HWK12:I10]PVZ34817.1 pyruvate dehydrogenase E2 component (dihydrolipoamide acetyltransferase) [Pseudomonas sp. URIL14HWK12:I11]SNZ09368.1 pyruvate dehydrogenase E2 component (dihydrolipo